MNDTEAIALGGWTARWFYDAGDELNWNDDWRRWNDALDAALASGPVRRELELTGMGAAMTAAQGYAVARYAAALDHGTVSLTDETFTAWLHGIGDDWTQLAATINRVFAAHGDQIAAQATRAWAELNRVPHLDPSGDTWDDPSVSLALQPLLRT